MDRLGRRLVGRGAFTLIEIAIAVAILGFVVALLVPRFGAAANRMRLTQASQTVAADLDLVMSLAAQQQHPVRLVYTASTGEYAMSDRVTGQLLRKRAIGASSEWRVDSVTFLPDTLDVSPTGLASSPVTVSLHKDGTRRVTMSRTGIVRVTSE